jgi:hypothetical protein
MTTEQFNALPKNEKAVLVAKDVLAQIKAKKYLPREGHYIHIAGGYNFNGSIKENFDQIKECTVCALGSMLMSSTHLGNILTTKDINSFPDKNDLKHSEKVTELFASIFTDKQLLLIETAFEGYTKFLEETKAEIKKYYQEDFIYQECDDRYATETLTFDETLACEMFYRKYYTGDKRLNAICRNIIKNGGIFIP